MYFCKLVKMPESMAERLRLAADLAGVNQTEFIRQAIAARLDVIDRALAEYDEQSTKH